MSYSLLGLTVQSTLLANKLCVVCEAKVCLSVFLIVVYILQQRVWGNFLFSTKSSINHGRVEKSCLLTFGRYSCSWVHTREEVAKGFARQSPHPGSNPDSPLAENLMFYCKSSRKRGVTLLVLLLLMSVL